jgi:hypothetical protein
MALLLVSCRFAARAHSHLLSCVLMVAKAQRNCSMRLGVNIGFSGGAMKKPTINQGTLHRDGVSPESDDPSDNCDFGYVLVESQPKLKRDGSGTGSETGVRAGTTRFDPMEDW